MWPGTFCTSWLWIPALLSKGQSYLCLMPETNLGVYPAIRAGVLHRLLISQAHLVHRHTRHVSQRSVLAFRNAFICLLHWQSFSCWQTLIMMLSSFLYVLMAKNFRRSWTELIRHKGGMWAWKYTGKRAYLCPHDAKLGRRSYNTEKTSWSDHWRLSSISNSVYRSRKKTPAYVGRHQEG